MRKMLHKGCNWRFMQGYGKVPASAHSACIGGYVFAPASTERRNPLQAIRSIQGHPTGGPSRGALRLLRSSRYALTQPDAFGAGASRDGHSQLSHTLKRIGSAREKQMENDFLVNCSTPFLVASTERRNPLPRFAVPRSAKHDNIDYAATFGTA